MGNTESGTSDEEDFKEVMNESKSQEVVRVFQPQKLRQELENGEYKKSTSTLIYYPYYIFLLFSCQA